MKATTFIQMSCLLGSALAAQESRQGRNSQQNQQTQKAQQAQNSQQNQQGHNTQQNQQDQQAQQNHQAQNGQQSQNSADFILPPIKFDIPFLSAIFPNPTATASYIKPAFTSILIPIPAYTLTQSAKTSGSLKMSPNWLLLIPSTQLNKEEYQSRAADQKMEFQNLAASIKSPVEHTNSVVRAQGHQNADDLSAMIAAPMKQLEGDFNKVAHFNIAGLRNGITTDSLGLGSVVDIVCSLLDSVIGLVEGLLGPNGLLGPSGVLGQILGQSGLSGILASLSGTSAESPTSWPISSTACSRPWAAWFQVGFPLYSRLRLVVFLLFLTLSVFKGLKNIIPGVTPTTTSLGP
ncbi:hypothetical protein B0H63DRAFT_551101 [Podospora didyma]|uniref:Uncharacterized protein n=1 Tax=Podospora didyma TaxID=330526 RepID=A0AAE0K9C4_9PEZI|nr:hypothetical protein B0H63DRAFT_551101 [Podospora didyma]